MSKVDLRQAQLEVEDDHALQQELFYLEYGNVDPEEARRMCDEDKWFEAQDALQELRHFREECDDLLRSIIKDHFEDLGTSIEAWDY
jgi:hypothetical protein